MFLAETSLLEYAKQIVRENHQEKRRNGEMFNVFELLGLNTDEVKICRLISGFLNPYGTYPFAFQVLESFIKTVLDIELDENEINSAKVYTEYKTDAGRRIDIVVETKYRFIPIEVKIYASDQNSQCSDYYHYADKKNKKYKSKVYYLTLDGHLPYDTGCIGLTEIEEEDVVVGYEELIPVSFKCQILEWLNICLNNDCVKNEAVSYAVLKQFKCSLERLCFDLNNEFDAKLTEYITKDTDTAKAANIISENFMNTKTQLLFKLFDALNQRIEQGEFSLKCLDNKFDYTNRAERFYRGKDTSYPGLSYKIKGLDNNQEIWFRIEIGYYLWCGFVITDHNEWTKCILTDDEIKKHLNMESRKDGCCMYWEFLPIDDENTDSTPNFKDLNELYYELFDDKKFTEFVDECSEKIFSLLGKVIKS